MALSVTTGRHSIKADIPSNERDNNVSAVETLAAYVREQLPNDLGQIHALLQLIDAFAWRISAHQTISRSDMSQISGAIGGVLKISDAVISRCSDMQPVAGKSLNEISCNYESNEDVADVLLNLIKDKLISMRGTLQ